MRNLVLSMNPNQISKNTDSIEIRKMVKSDINRVNMLLQKAFTQARIDEGFQNTHFPMCRPDYLESYLSACPQGCFVMENAGQLLAIVFCHLWGQTGWIGPLAVLPEKQLLGIGKKLASHAIDYLKNSNCRIIGLETNPRSMHNLGFYCKLGFLPMTLILDLIHRVPQKFTPVSQSCEKIFYYSQCSSLQKQKFDHDVQWLVSLVDPNVDYRSLIHSLEEYHYGDSILIYRHSVPAVYVSLQTLPCSSEERKSILRIHTLVAHPKTPDSYFNNLLSLLDSFAQSEGLSQMLFRIPIDCRRILNFILDCGFRIIHSDLRMELEGFSQGMDKQNVHINRWV
jgi:ribosomal protein S18 acetylase RimI-like enzyme